MNERADDITAQIVNAALDKIPQLDRNEVEDVIWAPAHPPVSRASTWPVSSR